MKEFKAMGRICLPSCCENKQAREANPSVEGGFLKKKVGDCCCCYLVACWVVFCLTAVDNRGWCRQRTPCDRSIRWGVRNDKAHGGWMLLPCSDCCYVSSIVGCRRFLSIRGYCERFPPVRSTRCCCLPRQAPLLPFRSRALTGHSHAGFKRGRKGWLVLLGIRTRTVSHLTSWNSRFASANPLCPILRWRTVGVSAMQLRNPKDGRLLQWSCWWSAIRKRFLNRRRGLSSVLLFFGTMCSKIRSCGDRVVRCRKKTTWCHVTCLLLRPLRDYYPSPLFCLVSLITAPFCITWSLTKSLLLIILNDGIQGRILKMPPRIVFFCLRFKERWCATHLFRREKERRGSGCLPLSFIIRFFPFKRPSRRTPSRGVVSL